MDEIKLHPYTVYITHTMLRYPTIAPSPFSVLNHLFYVLGNGYDFTGTAFRHYQDGNLADRPMLTGKAAQAFIKAINQKRAEEKERLGEREKRIIDILREAAKVDPEVAKELAEILQEDEPLVLSDLDYSVASAEKLTLEAFRADMAERMAGRKPDEYIRPYPLSCGPISFRITQKAPRWLKELMIAMHTTWLEVLQSELDNGFYSKKPGYEDLPQLMNSIKMLGSEIKRVEGML